MTRPDEPYELDEAHLALAEILNHVLDKGVVLTGDVIISVADVDLLRVHLALMVAAIETMDRREPADRPFMTRPPARGSLGARAGGERSDRG